MVSDLDEKRFPRISLERQAYALDVPLTTYKLRRTNNGEWMFKDDVFARPEAAAHALLGERDSIAAEGDPIFLWMKCAAFESLASRHSLGREDARFRYTKALLLNQRENKKQIIGAMLRASIDDVERAFDEIVDFAAEVNFRLNSPGISNMKTVIINLHKHAHERLVMATNYVICDPYTYSSGWPDIILANQECLRFVEIKTTDKIHASQRRIIEEIAHPCGLPIEVMRLSPM